MTNGVPIHIFLADDDEDDRFLFSDALKKSNVNAKLSTFEHCGQLLDALKTNKDLPDIIFLDINMPVITGKDCLKRLKKEAHLRHIPVIMYSTSSTMEDINETFHAGASLYVQKPFVFGDQVIMMQKIVVLHANGFLKNTDRENYVYKHS